jgi:integrase/recombinase XerD
MAKKLVRVLRTQHPDYQYLKKVFQYTRELLEVAPSRHPKRLPELLTDAELGDYSIFTGFAMAPEGHLS